MRLDSKEINLLMVIGLILLSVGTISRLRAQDEEQQEDLGQIEFGETFVSDGVQHFVVELQASITCGRDGYIPFTLSDDRSVNVVCVGSDEQEPPTVAPTETTTNTPEPRGTLPPTATSTLPPTETATSTPEPTQTGGIYTYPAEELNYRSGFVISEDDNGVINKILSFHNYENTWLDVPIEDDLGQCVSISFMYSMGHENGRIMAITFGEVVLPLNFPNTQSWGNFVVISEPVEIDSAAYDSLRLSTIEDADGEPLDGPRIDWIEVIPSDACNATPTPVAAVPVTPIVPTGQPRPQAYPIETQSPYPSPEDE